MGHIDEVESVARSWWSSGIPSEEERRRVGEQKIDSLDIVEESRGKERVKTFC
jgi:hypothetical protein